jgi:uncharacterized OB-fold protein
LTLISPNAKIAKQMKEESYIPVLRQHPYAGNRPKATPETQHFWDGCRQKQLLLQRCLDTGKAYFPPRPFSPYTGKRHVEIFPASGKAILYSYVITHREAPGFLSPYAIAVVELEEGPRIMTNIVECPQTPEALQLDMALEVTFVAIDEEYVLPQFRPARKETYEL